MNIFERIKYVHCFPKYCCKSKTVRTTLFRIGEQGQVDVTVKSLTIDSHTLYITTACLNWRNDIDTKV